MKRKLVSDPPATDYVDSHSSQFNNPDISSDGLLGLEDSGGGGSSCKRARTIFTADQLEKMEQEFHKQQYVVLSTAYLLILCLLSYSYHSYNILSIVTNFC